MSQQDFSWSSGQILQKRYQLQQKLGHNGDRQVWLSHDLDTHPPQSVIVKLLPFHAQMQWDEFKLFEREVDVLKSLNHPRSPRYLDSFTIDSETDICWFVLVESFIPGKSLTQVLQQGHHLTATQIRTIATQVLTLLIDLHERNPPLLHRDIKPSNLVLGPKRQVYLIDFGAVQDQTAIGVTSTIVGTSGYAPPEQFYGQAVPASDLYALGATLIHLLTGVSPADLPQQALRIQFRDSVSISDSFAEWIEKLTEPDVSDRFQSARQALVALNAVDLSPTERSLPQPAHSRIKLQKTETALRILLPGSGLSPQQVIVFCVQVALLGAILWFLVSKWVLTVLTSLVTPEDITFFVQFIRILASVPWAMTAWTVFKQLGQQWQPNQIVFRKDQAKFSLNWQLLGWRWWRQSGHIDQIQEVSISVQVIKQRIWSRKRSRPSRILIQTGARRYTFGAGFTEAEFIWLVQEIKHWLSSNH